MKRTMGRKLWDVPQSPAHQSLVALMGKVTVDTENCGVIAATYADVVAETLLPVGAAEVGKAFTRMIDRLGTIKTRRFSTKQRTRINRAFDMINKVSAGETAPAEASADAEAANGVAEHTNGAAEPTADSDAESPDGKMPPAETARDQPTDGAAAPA